MTVFEKNITALEKKEPELAEAISNLKESLRVKRVTGDGRKSSLQVDAPSGKGVINIPQLHSPQLGSKAEELSAVRMVCVLGIGSGDLLSEVVNRTPENTFVLLIEPDIDFFSAVLREWDFSSIFELERVSISVAEEATVATFARAEMEYSVFAMNDFLVLENEWSAPLYKEYFTEVKAKLEELKDFGDQNIITLTAESSKWRDNTFENLPYILSSPPAKSLFDKFKNIPAVVVSAGPSLNKNGHMLSSFKGRGIIIAVDTAVRTLVNIGVTPDIVVALDANVENYQHLEGLSLPHTLMVLNPVVHPMIVSEHTGEKVFIDYPDPLLRWLEDYIGDLGTIRAGGSVATSAFDLAIKLGCSPITFVGQDMAYTNNMTHASGTVHDLLLSGGGTAKLPEACLKETYETEGVFGETLRTTKKMNAWRKWFELIISHDSVTAFNATEGGVPIKGARSIPLAEFLERYGSSGVSLNLEAGAIPEERADTAKVVNALLTLRDDARLIKRICGSGLGSIKGIMSELPEASDEIPENVRALIGGIGETARKTLEVKNFCEANRWSVDFILDKVDKVQRGIRNIRSEKDKNYITIEAYRTLFSSFYDTAGEFERSVSLAIKRLEREMRKKDGILA